MTPNSNRQGLVDNLKIIRTDSNNPDFIALVRLLDAELAERDGCEHSFYAQYNKIDMIKNAVIAYLDNEPVGCGAIKPYSDSTAEVKRMYTKPEYRGKGIAVHILNELEKWAYELNFKDCILETGKKQPEAIRLYEKSGYTYIPNYGQYAAIENSVCMKKVIS
jgi:GNAT superfamily N-acetyltransferase